LFGKCTADLVIAVDLTFFQRNSGDSSPHMKCEIKDVFHPSDFTRGSEAAFCHALRIALAVRGRLTIFHSEDSTDATQWEDFPSATHYLHNWGMISRNGGHDAIAELGVYIKKIQADGKDAASQIRNYLDGHQPDLIVMSTHQRKGLARWMHRAVAEPVARGTEAMSLFVPRSTRGFISPTSGMQLLSSILIPIDSYPNPQRAVDAAVALARLLCESEPVVFTLLFAGAADDIPLVRFPREANWQIVEHCVEGKPGEVILDAVEEFDVDLIVMATHGKKGFLDALRGSTTERVIRAAPCPVLAVPVVSGEL
jgi:nucleotide-binding universal stress UspA family protein